MIFYTKNLLLPRNRKFYQEFLGHFSIIKKLSEVSFILHLSYTLPLHPIFHVFYYKKWTLPNLAVVTRSSPITFEKEK